LTGDAAPFVFPDTTPPPAVAASLPVDVPRYESFKATGAPLMDTVLEPFFRSLLRAMLGKGMGTGPVGPGTWHTSAKPTTVRGYRKWSTIQPGSREFILRA